ncbi:hypothetical protein [Methylobacterium isbiliense]|uniref:Uncharacterized protein n=1 Tax=Methylobacterium isbiliense TaxID=315478 RepID=A0ABQ4S5U4_9HYPH|nr:hypothetical protein [Methylobacterium isbiliense]MDN3622198.1 hypothetical protein [Methylobacterium isbiliense]GJD98513.1 hypothetical protein GMJLKIPL_0424 [Methylobacterium isbiliense]
MIGSWLRLSMEAARLAAEANMVIGLRVAKLSRGGPAARKEARRMVSEKVEAAARAAQLTATGGTPLQVVKGYRRKVRANAKRLRKG